MSQTDIFLGGAIIILVSWLVGPRVIRDIGARKKHDSTASDFDITVNRWLDVIADRQQMLPTGFGLRLGGAIDLHVAALEDIRANSLPDIEVFMRGVRVHLKDATKSRLDDEWRKYQEYQMTGIDAQECKKALMDILEQMKKIVHEV
jgi:hypothetical protein